MLSFEKQEQEKANESLYKINFGIPWFDDLDLMPGNSIIVSGLANTGNYFAVCNEKYPSILQIIRTE